MHSIQISLLTKYVCHLPFSAILIQQNKQHRLLWIRCIYNKLNLHRKGVCLFVYLFENDNDFILHNAALNQCRLRWLNWIAGGWRGCLVNSPHRDQRYSLSVSVSLLSGSVQLSELPFTYYWWLPLASGRFHPLPLGWRSCACLHLSSIFFLLPSLPQALRSVWTLISQPVPRRGPWGTFFRWALLVCRLMIKVHTQGSPSKRSAQTYSSFYKLLLWSLPSTTELSRVSVHRKAEFIFTE